ncbi:MAG TPA: UpxY family transcription antiterminator [Candidatus Acidoferrum sp.]|nr:UpxY family transcription antiterminator [Candidatus Acidoferrum sp.]
MSENTQEWFAVHTRYQHERTVLSILQAKGFQTFLPTYKEVRRWRDRKKLISLPLFPGYLFVNDLRERRIEVLSAPGACAIVSFQGIPAAIPHEEMEAVQRIAANPEKLRPHPYLKNGDLVQVASGPLAGVYGMMVAEKDDCWLVISIQILGRSAAVAIDRHCVMPVSPGLRTSQGFETVSLSVASKAGPSPGCSVRCA